jgi:CBS domain-containing protein
VAKAVKLMAQRKVGAVLVVDGENLVGIFTGRDAAFRVIAKDRDANTTRLADVMTPGRARSIPASRSATRCS